VIELCIVFGLAVAGGLGTVLLHGLRPHADLGRRDRRQVECSAEWPLAALAGRIGVLTVRCGLPASDGARHL
jgi:hypothetical protein